MTKQEFSDHIQIKAPYLAWCAGFTFDAATKYAIDPFLLLAICDRESRGGLGLKAGGRGYDGHGCGIFQFDDRYWPEFCLADAHVPEKAADKAAWLLVKYAKQLGSLQHAVAAYNCGPGGVRRAIAEGEHIDANTTGQDYSGWVYKRAAQLKKGA